MHVKTQTAALEWEGRGLAQVKKEEDELNKAFGSGHKLDVDKLLNKSDKTKMTTVQLFGDQKQCEIAQRCGAFELAGLSLVSPPPPLSLPLSRHLPSLGGQQLFRHPKHRSLYPKCLLLHHHQGWVYMNPAGRRLTAAALAAGTSRALQALLRRGPHDLLTA